MGKLSQRIGELKSRGGRAPEKRNDSTGIAHRQPAGADAGWPIGPQPKPPSPMQNMLFLFAAAVLIVLMNAIFWGRGGDAPTIDPVTGRQLNQSEPWN